ncbi:uncharacterized protein L201_005175 [Kwoniella dendrophila CBS 6074]|uniref:Uncharacterized protein n=1 Tax=Kwoniella dendrophila CBS 6074 TaxID=1295534 RepID=A0AAX4JY15_9TREE
MPSSSEFFNSIRQKSKRKASHQYQRHQPDSIKHSGTSYTLNNWVDIDYNGNGILLNINQNENNSARQRQHSTCSAVSTDTERMSQMSHTENAIYHPDENYTGSRVFRLNDENQENIQIEKRSGKYSTSTTANRLKRTSMQLLKMVDRKSSSSTRSRENREDQLKRSIRHPTLDNHETTCRDSIDYTVEEENLPGPSRSRFEISPPHTPPSPSLYTPYLASDAYPNDPSQRRIYDASSSSTNLTIKHFTPIPSSYPHLKLHDYHTPEGYHTFIGDSDSSGKKTTLKPIRSIVPHNTPNDSPLSGFGININRDDFYGGQPKMKRRMTFDELVNLPLPQPNDEPSRYIQPNKYVHSLASTTKLDSDIPIQYITTEKKSRENQRNLNMDFKQIKIEDSQEGQDQYFDAQPQKEDDHSSALEALWEYGSVSSSGSSNSLVAEARAAAIAGIKDHKDLEVELDLEIDLNDYPFPPGEISSLPTQESLIVDSDQPVISKTKDIRKPDKEHIPKPITISSPVKNHTVGVQRKVLPESNSITQQLPISSPLSDTFSLLDEEEEEEEPEIKSASIAYKIPLKFERPQAQIRSYSDNSKDINGNTNVKDVDDKKHKRSSLSIDSPFIELYKISNPNEIDNGE